MFRSGLHEGNIILRLVRKQEGFHSSVVSVAPQKENSHCSFVILCDPQDKPDPKEMTKWSFNGDKLKANFKKSFIGQAICDRKRKERQESISQDDCGQEKKVVR